MKGFLKRDFYLIRGNLKFYALFTAVFGGLALTHSGAAMVSPMVSTYLVIFIVSSMMSLFSYDEFNRWMAYGATAPEGRVAMVDARYLLTVLLGLGIVAVQIALGLLARADNMFPMTAIYTAIYLLYASLTLPVYYRFGGTKARTMMILVLAGMAAVVGVGGAILGISGSNGLRLPPITLLAPLVGAAVLAISWRISLGIMAKKEL